VDAALGFGLGDALDAVGAAFVFEVFVYFVAFDGEADFFVASGFGGAGVE